MLLNLSSHPFVSWSKKQINRAVVLFSSIQDFPFPQIDANASKKEVYNLAQKYSYICKRILSESPDKNNAIHVMGEHTFVFYLVTLLKKKNIKCIASTTSRNSKQFGKEKLSVFGFISFREY